MNYDKALIAGNLTRDPELTYIQSGTACCKFGVAVNRRYTVDGEVKEKVAFIDCVAWGRLGEVIAKHFSRGKPIFVEGHHSYSSWTDQQGNRRSKLEISVETFKFVGPKADSEGTAPAADDSIPF